MESAFGIPIGHMQISYLLCNYVLNYNAEYDINTVKENLFSLLIILINN